MKYIFFVCSFLLMAGSSMACGVEANTPEKLMQRQEDAFKRYDKNRSGSITVDEFVFWETKQNYSMHTDAQPFLASDLDRSGDVSLEEWKAFRPAKYYKTKGGC